jgi:hypothetical protein
VIFSLDLRKDSPVGVSEQFNEEHAGGGPSLADGLGCPMFLELNEEEIVAQLSLSDGGGVAAHVLVDEPQLAVVGVPRAIGVVAQRQMVGEPGHGWVRMLVIDRVGEVSGGGPNGCQ